MNAIRKLLLASGSIVVLVFYLNASLELTRSRRQLEPISVSELQFPSPSLIRAISLNYDTVAADLMWVALVVNYGESRRVGHHPDHLVTNALKIAEVDPHLYALYEWAPAAYLNHLGDVREEDIVAANRILRKGTTAFPNNHELPYSAALNYIGYSADAAKDRRIREIKRALKLLDEVISRPGAPASVGGTSAYFVERLAELEGEDFDREALREREIQFNLNLLDRVTQPERRRRIIANLKSLGLEKEELLAQLTALDRELDAARKDDLPYVPTSLWLQIAMPPTKEAPDA